jgi:hypothetical protein
MSHSESPESTESPQSTESPAATDIPVMPNTSKPSVPSPASLASRVRRPVKAALVGGLDPEVFASASAFGTVEGDTVIVTDGESRHEVGLAKGDNPLVVYVKKYLAHLAALERFEAKLGSSEPTLREIDASLAAARTVLSKPDCVGDLAAFRTRLDVISERATALREKLTREREEAKAVATAEREKLVLRAEEIAAKDEDAIQWKIDAVELKELLDAWKVAQQSSIHIGKEAERDLWHRFAHARSTFEKTRKHHFAELDRVNTAVADRKEALVKRAETLADSTKWDDTAREFRDLMTEWKGAGRGRKSLDDAQWIRFQTAQDAFFTAKRISLESERSVEEANLAVKEALLKEAEALLPIKDLNAARTALHSIQDRFEAAGRVPKAEITSLSKRLSAVERSIREATEAAWSRRNPEVEARVSGAEQQLVEAIADLEIQIAKATSTGDAKALKDLSESRDARLAWLAQIRASASS